MQIHGVSIPGRRTDFAKPWGTRRSGVWRGMSGRRVEEMRSGGLGSANVRTLLFIGGRVFGRIMVSGRVSVCINVCTSEQRAGCVHVCVLSATGSQVGLTGPVSYIHTVFCPRGCSFRTRVRSPPAHLRSTRCSFLPSSIRNTCGSHSPAQDLRGTHPCSAPPPRLPLLT